MSSKKSGTSAPAKKAARKGKTAPPGRLVVVWKFEDGDMVEGTLEEHIRGREREMRFIGALDAKRARSAASVASARSPRPSARSQIKGAILAIMRPYKAEHAEFKTFLAAWELGPLSGLRLSVTGDGFLVTDENDGTQQPYTLGTLTGMYSKALLRPPPV